MKQKASTLLQSKFYICLFLIGFAKTTFAQLPNCAGIDSNKIFFLGGDTIFRFDPTLAISATNPTPFIWGTGFRNGLTISNNFNGGAASPTFYSVNNNTMYDYWDGAAWVATGHGCSSVNPGGGLNWIYGYIGGSNDIYRYNGTGAATLLTTIAGAGPYDLVTDALDNFYFFNANIVPGYIVKHSPLGVVLDSITVTGHPSSSAGGGYATVGNTAMASFSGTDVWLGTIAAGAVNLTQVGNVWFTISDVAQCPASPFVNNPFNGSFTAPDTTCGNLCITPINTSNGNIVSYQWTFPGANPLASTLQNPGQICYANSGPHVITLVVTDSLGNMDTASKTVYVSAAQTVITTPNKITCTPGDTTQLVATGSVLYSWTPATNLSCVNCSSPFATPTVTTNYVATGTDNIGCKTKDTVTVKVVPLNVQLTVVDDSICITQNLIATATISGAAPTFYWDLGFGAPILTPVINTPLPAAGTYFIQVFAMDTLGCKDTASKIIYVEDLGYANFYILDSTLCEGQPIQIVDTFGSAPLSFNWTFPDLFVLQNVHNPSYTPINTFGYNVVKLTADYAYCPDLVINKNVSITPYPSINLGADTTICPGVTGPLTLSALTAGAITVQWQDGTIGNNFVAAQPATYYAIATTNGCSSTDTILIKRDCYLDIPNSFTPNGDGLNDYFLPMDLLSAGVTNFSMDIFNRWGELIFSTTNLNSAGWDGKFGGKPQPVGTFVYQITATFKNNERKTYAGNITLLR
jgi:gliding motility-associated-like protein